MSARSPDTSPEAERLQLALLRRASPARKFELVRSLSASVIGLSRQGGGVSDRQWGDILGVLKARGERLDRDHLDRWARELDLVDLPERALREAAG